VAEVLLSVATACPSPPSPLAADVVASLSASRGKVVAYAFDIPAWAVCHACNTSADNRPRLLTLWPFFLAHSRIDVSVSRL
jgi:hypothetical protein